MKEIFLPKVEKYLFNYIIILLLTIRKDFIEFLFSILKIWLLSVAKKASFIPHSSLLIPHS